MAGTARALTLKAVKISAAVADRVHPPGRGVVVLLYHRVGGNSGLEIDLPVDMFDRQIRFLAECERASTLADGLAALARPERPERDPVVVTFDDGTADVVDMAIPVLERHRVPATLYLTTDFIERQRPFPHDGKPVSWAALTDAISTGLLSVGSHTHTHAVLDRLSPAGIDEELSRSTQLIQDRLQVDALDFAYPKGVATSVVADRAVRQHFRSAALGIVRANPYGGTDPHQLARSPIQVSDEMRWFTRKVDGGLALEGTLRRMLNGRRYAGTST